MVGLCVILCKLCALDCSLFCSVHSIELICVFIVTKNKSTSTKKQLNFSRKANLRFLVIMQCACVLCACVRMRCDIVGRMSFIFVDVTILCTYVCSSFVRYIVRSHLIQIIFHFPSFSHLFFHSYSFIHSTFLFIYRNYLKCSIRIRNQFHRCDFLNQHFT